MFLYAFTCCLYHKTRKIYFILVWCFKVSPLGFFSIFKCTKITSIEFCIKPLTIHSLWSLFNFTLFAIVNVYGVAM